MKKFLLIVAFVGFVINTFSQTNTFPTSGNVGIGTTSPNIKLEIRTNSDSLFTVASFCNTINGLSAINKGTAITLGYSPFEYFTKIATVYEKNNPDYINPGLAFYTMNNSYLAGSEVERMRISSSGNIGIGVSNPTFQLELNTTSGANLFKFSRAGTPIGYITASNNDLEFGSLTNNMRFDIPSGKVYSFSTGNVGIGTTTPWSGAKLTVESVLATKPAGVDGYYSYLKSNWSEVNAFEMGISDGSNWHKLLTSSNYYFGSTLQFWTADNERMRIVSNGNVGIGTTTPENLFTVGKSDVNSTNLPKMRVQGTGIYDGTTYYGNYGGIIFNANSSYTASAKRFLITNALEINKFAIIRSIDYNNDPVLGTAGVLSSGTADFVINSIGNIGIGTTNPQSKLAVNGTITTKEVNVTLEGWADFIFKPTYKLRPLGEVEQFIKTNSHLPEIPSEKDVKENGISLGEMNAKLLQKIEELTLYMIEQQKQINELREQNVTLANEIKTIKK